MARRPISHLIEQASGVLGQRIQENTDRAFKQLEKTTERIPELVVELVDGQVKSYDPGEYEIFHNLGRACEAISVAYCNGLTLIYSVEESNPQNLDRTLYTRILVRPVQSTASDIVDDATARRLKFWVI
jgi:hypothetical protein